MLIIAGSLARPAGKISSSLQILNSGLLEQHGVLRVGVAGHPEGHPAIDSAALAHAIAEKNRFAAESGVETYILTQFCFAAEPYVRYERELRAAGNQLPVRAGLPGPASMKTLLKYAVSCGIGASLRALRRQARGLSALLRPRPYNPEPLVIGIAEAHARDPASRFESLHWYPFGALEETAEWIRKLTTAEIAQSHM